MTQQKQNKLDAKKIYGQSILKSLGWTLIVFIISVLPILIGFVHQSLLESQEFKIQNHLVNGNLIIASIGLAGAAWVDSMFTDYSDKMYRFPEIMIFLISIFSISIFLTLDTHNPDEISIEGLNKLCFSMLLVCFIYAVLLKATIFTLADLEK